MPSPEGAAPGWLGVVDVPILLGRDVSLGDIAASNYPVVIGSDLARALWGGASTSTDTPARVFTARGKQWRHDFVLVRTRGPGGAVHAGVAAFPACARAVNAGRFDADARPGR